MDRDTWHQVGIFAVILIALVASFLASVVGHAGIEKASDKIFAESSVDQKLDALYQQNKEIRQAIEECKLWILAK